MPILSVIVPMYNVETYAAQTLRSLAANADPDIEFVLVNDFSTDSTADILADGAPRVPGATVVSPAEHIGLSAGRNLGLAEARGRYITYLDGDDAAAPGYFRQLLDCITTLGCSFVRTDHVQVTDTTRRLHRVVHAPRGVVCPPRTGIGPAHHPSAVDAPNAWSGAYDREQLGDELLQFDTALRTCEDRPWVWRLHLEGPSFAVVGLHGVRYRRGVATSLTQLKDERQFDFIPACEQIVDRARRDHEAQRLIPKAVRTLAAMVCHHNSMLEHYPPHLARELERRSGQALNRLPGPELQQAIAGLDAPRAATLSRLSQAAR